MFLQLSEIRKQQALIQNLEQSKQKTHEILIGSYSFNKKVQKPLRERFGSIINQSALLLHNLREIQDSVKHKCLLPSFINDRELNKLIYNRGILPQWFEHVFQKEYEKEKINIEVIANKFYKLHGLSQKFLALQKGHQNLQTLFIRYETINHKELDKLDIVQQMNSFQNQYKNCKEIFKNFLFLMSKKVLQFLQKTVQSTLVYSNQLRKVKSSQNLPFLSTVYNPKSPNIYLQKKDLIDTTLIKNNNVKNINKIQDYFPQSINQTKGKLHKNSTVQSLRQREKQNNQFFFKKAILKDKFNQTFQTQQIKSPYRSQQKNRYESPINISTFRQQQTSRDPSIRQQRNFYKQSLAIKDSSSIRNAKSIDQTQLYSNKYKNPTKNYKERAIQKLGMQKVQKQCFHHCPHHDKLMNNHCSKHCDKICSHQKQYLKDFGLDLTKMDRQFYKSRQKINQEQLKTYRSTDLSRSNRSYLQPQFKESKYVSKMKRKEYENLRNSNEKYSSISQNKGQIYKSAYSPLRQNRDYSTRPNIINHFNQPSYLQQRHPSPLSHTKHQPLTYRSQYYC